MRQTLPIGEALTVDSIGLYRPHNRQKLNESFLKDYAGDTGGQATGKHPTEHGTKAEAGDVTFSLFGHPAKTTNLNGDRAEV